MFNKRHIVRTIAATASILALSFTAACGSGQSTASIPPIRTTSPSRRTSRAS